MHLSLDSHPAVRPGSHGRGTQLGLLALLVLVAGASPGAGAQPARRPIATDTLLVRTLTGGILDALREDLVSLVVDHGTVPWTVVVHDSTNALWRRVQAGLRTLLVPATTDSVAPHRLVLEVGPMRQQGDTALVELDLLSRTVSPSGCRSAGGMSYRVRSVYRDGAWNRADVHPFRDELPMPCP